MALIVLGTGALVVIANPALGYIAGESPDGIVTLDSVPGVAVVDLLVRATNLWIRREVSRLDGTYRFDALPLGVQYDVIGRDITDTWGDVIVSRVQPYAPPEITTPTLTFIAGTPATTQMTAQYGGSTLGWTIDTLPPGLSMNASGLWSGTGSASSTPVVITVTDEFGESSSRNYTITVA